MISEILSATRAAARAAVLVVAFCVAPALLHSALAHEGHDHGADTPSAPSVAQPRAEAHSDSLELVAIAQGVELVVYLDRFKTNEPVAGAKIEIETPEGPASATGGEDGVYRLAAPWLAKGGHIDLVFTVTAGEEVEILPVALDIPAATAGAAAQTWRAVLGARVRAMLTPAVAGAALFGFLAGIVLMAFGPRRNAAAAVLLAALLAAPNPSRAHEGHDHGDSKPAAAAAGDRAVRQPDGAVFVPKPIQRIFGLRTLTTEPGRFARTVELPGRIIPDPNASGFVQASAGGRLSPPPGGFPRLGAKVKQGDVLAYVTAALQAIDISDIRQRQGELDQQIAIVERRLKRFETLAPSGAIARSQLEETQLELDGLRDRRRAIDKQAREPEALVAPVSGVIAEGSPVAGQVVQSNAVVFHIVDPAKLWVEALSFHAVNGVDAASALTASGGALALTFRGSGLAGRSQSIPVHFAIEQAANGLRAGEFVTVFAQTGEGREGIAVPRSAVVRATNGQDFVFEHVTAERFQPRPVRIEPLDSERVLVSAGVERGKRVVVQGAELLDHVR